MFKVDGTRLIWRFDAQQLWLEPWGENSLRVRATQEAEMPCRDWALLSVEPAHDTHITIADREARITNGKLEARVSASGRLSYYNADGKLLLEEFVRDMSQPDYTSHMRIYGREFKPIRGGLYELTARFESSRDEKAIWYGPVSAAHAEPQRRAAGTCAAQLASQRTVRAVQPWLWHVVA